MTISKIGYIWPYCNKSLLLPKALLEAHLFKKSKNYTAPTCLVHASVDARTCLVHASIAAGACLVHACCMLALMQGHVWCMLAFMYRHAWCILAMLHGHVWWMLSMIHGPNMLSAYFQTTDSKCISVNPALLFPSSVVVNCSVLVHHPCTHIVIAAETVP